MYLKEPYNDCMAVKKSPLLNYFKMENLYEAC